MGWIKRNLIFVVGGALALALLGTAGFFIYKGWSRNSDASAKLNEIYDTLKTLAAQKPSPGNDKIDNAQIAKEQEKQLREWIAKSADTFKPVPSIPEGKPVTSEAYAAALRKTIDTMQHLAESASVTLPPKYDFSFSAQRSLVKFAGTSLDPLAVQLGEVKAMSEILFAARINALVSIQRLRVSDDDASGVQSDYTDLTPITNDLAVITPYVLTFRSFSPELARVCSGFAASQNPFIIKAINVQPAGAAANSNPNGDATPEAAAAMQGIQGRYFPRGGLMRGEIGMMPGGEQPPLQPVQPAVGKGGLQTVLKEQLLQITLEVDIVKPLPKS